MSTYIIYKTTNLVNNKIYIGQHNTSADDGYLGSGSILGKSIKKYNRENFKREILECCTSFDVNEKEIYWIKELSATDRKIGYNITLGGDGVKGMIGQLNHFYGKHHSEETKKIISASSVKIHTGRKRSKTTKEKIANSKIGTKNPQSKLDEKKVLCILKMLIDGMSTSIIAEKYGLAKSTIRKIRQRKIWVHVWPECKIPNSKYNRYTY